MNFFERVYSFLLRRSLGQDRGRRILLRRAVNKHNQLYKEISALAIQLENGTHPKHRIMDLHKFFVDAVSADDRILDLGCGHGFIAHSVAGKAKSVTGIDINSTHIAIAKGKYQRPNLQFIEGDALTYAFEGNFDKIVLSNVLEHIETRVPFLQNLHALSSCVLLRVPMLSRDWLSVYKKEMGFEYRLDRTHFIEYTLADLLQELQASHWQLQTYSIQFGELWGTLIPDNDSAGSTGTGT